MAIVSGGSSAAIRMDRLDLGDLIDGDTIEQSAFTLQLDNGAGNVDTFRGIHFIYGEMDVVEHDRLVDGILFAFNRSAGGETILDISALTTRLKKFVELARADNDSAALAIAFADDDSMRGTAFDDLLNGYAGADDLFGGAGADTLRGGAGNDHLYGLSGDDASDGQPDGNDSISGEDGNDYLQGDGGNDTLDGGTGADRIEGGRGDDVLRGGAGGDTLNGNLGDDMIDGGDGNDSLRGGQGGDSLSGGAGADRLNGDLGADILRGGAGSDIFIFTGGSAALAGSRPDIIADFENGLDRIALGFNVAAVLQGGRQSSLASATAAAQGLFDGRAGDGEVAVFAVGRDTYLFFSGTGDGRADSAVELSGFTQTAGIGLGDFV